jgi:hypothetical protein
MLNFCGIVVAILKMAAAKFLPVSIFKMATTILQKIKLRICHNAKCSFKLLSVAADNVEFLRYCGGHFENGGW